MEFFANIELAVAAEIGTATAVGSLVLEIAEGDDIICSRKFDVEFSLLKTSGQETQRILVQDGQERIFLHEGQSGDSSISDMNTEDQIKFNLFYFLVEDCMRNGGVLVRQLGLIEWPPETESVLLRLCRGNAPLN